MTGKELREVRRASGLGQAEFARWLGVRANHLYKLEKEYPGPDGEPLKASKTLERLAVLLVDKKNREKILSML